MAITAALVKELRERTGAGMMECKKALVDTAGDIEAAIESMRKSGQAKAAIARRECLGRAPHLQVSKAPYHEVAQRVPVGAADQKPTGFVHQQVKEGVVSA